MSLSDRVDFSQTNLPRKVSLQADLTTCPRARRHRLRRLVGDLIWDPAWDRDRDIILAHPTELLLISQGTRLRL